MGNSKSGALSKEILEELQLNTKFTEEELSSWYQSFLTMMVLFTRSY